MTTVPKPLQTVPERLRWLRERRGLTQAEVAERGGLHFQHVSRYEREDHDLRMSTLRALAAGLGCTVGDIVDGTA